MNSNKIYALILGGYVNGYSIIRELYEHKVENIALFSYGRSLASFSNKIDYFKSIDKSADSLKDAILKLKKRCDYIVIFPTDDIQLENLHTIYDEIKDFCFVPFNYDNVLQSLDKFVQYSFCQKYDIPYPKTISLETINDLEKLNDFMFPVLIKPNKREDLTTNVFRSLFLNTKEDFLKNKRLLENFIQQKMTFLASEFIPGDDTNIYAYVGYRSKEGKILNEWTGKKLTQFPDLFGVFSSASNEASEIIKEQGRKLLEVMNLFGICEPEFKYDIRDNKYKLMEINLRSMMWHRTGNKSGVYIQYSQYLDAIGKKVPKYTQIKDKKIHFVYMKHELINSFTRKGYWKFFKHNLFGGDERYFAVFDSKDIKPFLFDSLNFIKGLIGQWLRVLKIK
jgi:predicted ATP-grasp superfamily ATP-dependent carboligase